MKTAQFSLVLSLVLMAVACNKEEQTPPPAEVPADMVAPPDMDSTMDGTELEGTPTEGMEAPAAEAAPAAEGI